ncbi:MAG TPA: DinB family protein [Chitinophagaceae bacterium]|nr:DinB family protein [Chitinophagaceae bacterium]
MATKQDALATEYYQNYIKLSPDDNVVKALERNTKNFRRLLKKIPRKKVDKAYAEGKWTIKELLQHIIDAERVFAYRAITFARKDSAALPSFDENAWAANSLAVQRDWKDMIEEFKSLRAASEKMFSSFDDSQLRSIGNASGKDINVLALGYIMSGHVEHHINIIKERYLRKNGQ